MVRGWACALHGTAPGRAIVPSFLLQKIARRRRFAKAMQLPRRGFRCCEASAREIGRASADHGQHIRPGRPVCHSMPQGLCAVRTAIPVRHREKPQRLPYAHIMIIMCLRVPSRFGRRQRDATCEAHGSPEVPRTWRVRANCTAVWGAKATVAGTGVPPTCVPPPTWLKKSG